MVKGWKPEMGTAFLTYIEMAPNVGREFETSPQYRLSEVTAADDPAFDLMPRWQAALARDLVVAGRWCHLVAYDTETGDKVGHVWVTLESTSGLANGVMNVRLRHDEAYVFDLFIDPRHRRAALGNAMGQWLIQTFESRGVAWGLTHVMYDNAASVMWHHMFGFNWMQVFNYVHIGDRIWWKVPFGECPRFGPLSRRGRHSMAEPPDPFGGALIPQQLI